MGNTGIYGIPEGASTREQERMELKLAGMEEGVEDVLEVFDLRTMGA